MSFEFIGFLLSFPVDIDVSVGERWLIVKSGGGEHLFEDELRIA